MTTIIRRKRASRKVRLTKFENSVWKILMKFDRKIIQLGDRIQETRWRMDNDR